MLRIVANVLNARGPGPIVAAGGLALVGALAAYLVWRILERADATGA